MVTKLLHLVFHISTHKANKLLEKVKAKVFATFFAEFATSAAFWLERVVRVSIGLTNNGGWLQHMDDVASTPPLLLFLTNDSTRRFGRRRRLRMRF